MPIAASPFAGDCAGMSARAAPQTRTTAAAPIQATTVSTPTTDLFVIILGTTSLTPTATRAGIISVIALNTGRRATGGGGDTPAVFAFSALIAISARGLAMSSSAVVARDKVQRTKAALAQ